MGESLSVSFFGTRGSLPVSGPEHTEVGGATSCLRVEAGEHTLIFDAGSGLLELSQELMAEFRRADDASDRTHHIFLTHLHLDHIVGLPYFSPFHAPDADVHIWGPQNDRNRTLEDIIGEFIHPPFFPVPLYEMAAQIEFHHLMEPERVLFTDDGVAAWRPNDTDAPDEPDVELRTIRGHNHPKSGVNHYRVDIGAKSFVYATDTEGYPQADRRLIDFASGADLLVHDGMYDEEEYTSLPTPTQGFGHATIHDAVEVAERADVESLALFHHDPLKDDETLEQLEHRAQSASPEAFLARDGMTVEL